MLLLLKVPVPYRHECIVGIGDVMPGLPVIVVLHLVLGHPGVIVILPSRTLCDDTGDYDFAEEVDLDPRRSVPEIRAPGHICWSVDFR